jgi:ATP-dependent Clp protease ATP-binding subunit ClpC
MFRRRPPERFTVRARRVLSLAQEEAERRKAYFIEPEHILIGLLQEEAGIAWRVLCDMELTLDAVQGTIDHLSKPALPKKEAWIDLAPETKTLLRKAVEEARHLKHLHVGTEHLLLGLMHVKQSTVQKVLQQLGVDYEQMRHHLLETIAANPVPAPSLTPPLQPSVTVSTSSENITSHNTYYQNYPSPFVRLLALFGLDSQKDSEA